VLQIYTCLMVADNDELGGEVEFNDVASLISFNNSSLVEVVSLSCDYKLSGGEAEVCQREAQERDVGCTTVSSRLASNAGIRWFKAGAGTAYSA
jgi:hypothetical protein